MGKRANKSPASAQKQTDLNAHFTKKPKPVVKLELNSIKEDPNVKHEVKVKDEIMKTKDAIPTPLTSTPLASEDGFVTPETKYQELHTPDSQHSGQGLSSLLDAPAIKTPQAATLEAGQTEFDKDFSGETPTPTPVETVQPPSTNKLPENTAERDVQGRVKRCRFAASPEEIERLKAMTSPEHMDKSERNRQFSAMGRAMQKEGIPPAVLARWSLDSGDNVKKISFLIEWMCDPTWGTITLREEHYRHAETFKKTQWKWVMQKDLESQYGSDPEGLAFIKDLVKGAKTAWHPEKKGDKKFRLFRILDKMIEGREDRHGHKRGVTIEADVDTPAGAKMLHQAVDRMGTGLEDVDMAAIDAAMDIKDGKPQGNKGDDDDDEEKPSGGRGGKGGNNTTGGKLTTPKPKKEVDPETAFLNGCRQWTNYLNDDSDECTKLSRDLKALDMTSSKPFLEELEKARIYFDQVRKKMNDLIGANASCPDLKKTMEELKDPIKKQRDNMIDIRLWIQAKKKQLTPPSPGAKAKGKAKAKATPKAGREIPSLPVAKDTAPAPAPEEKKGD